jgi:glycosyltransferase involved in cell wall biosynthesis
VTRIYSKAFHTSYQYSLAYCFPDIVWTFDGWWTENRPLLPNVELTQTGDFYDFDLYLAHHPLHYSQLACELEARGIPRERIIYIQHWAYQKSLWQHNYDGVGLGVFLDDLSQSAIVCVSQFMKDQFGFYSDIGVHTIPHYVPPHLFDVAAWVPGNQTYINVVNNFYQPYRGVGARFWDSIDFVPKKLYGTGNKETDAGSLNTVEDYKKAVSEAAAYLWTADAAAISFAPLEAMLMGCPVIAPRNVDWPLIYDDRVNILLYEEGNIGSCKEAVDYFRSSERIQLDLSRRGREAILAMNSAELFTERWTRVLDAALASAARGVWRLKTDADAPLSKSTLVRRSGMNGGYELVTSFEIAGKDVAVGHPAKRWLNPRQVFRKYKSLRVFSPVCAAEDLRHCRG